MFSSLLTVLVLTVSAPLPEREVPKGPPPRVMTVEVEADGSLVLAIQRTVYKNVPVVYQVQVGNKVETRTKLEVIAESVHVKISLEDKDVQVFGSDGKRIGATEIRGKIARTSPVLVSSDGKPVDPFFLKLAREGTLIVVSPQLVDGNAPARLPERIPVPLPGPRVPPKE